tara:strand:+ start:871 stop:1569 length:699 start_codon:yes stop_codon:yes gene_type:complete
MSGTHYVYEHWRPDTDVCFYVGKGSGKRANVMARRDKQHRHIQAKLARNGMCVEVRLVFDGLSEKEAYLQERRRIKFWKAFNVALVNRTDGGEGGPGFKHSEEARAKIRAAHIGNKKGIGCKITPEHRAKISAAQKGKVMSAETRAKLSAATKLQMSSPEARAKNSEATKLQMSSPEARARLREAATGKTLSPEAREKLRKALTGRPRPPEVRAKISAGHARRSIAKEGISS